jgi:hypothetical protein
VKVVVTFDGTKYCYHKVSDEGKEVESKCCDAKQVVVKGECVVEGYTDKPGFIVTCGNAEVACEGGRVVVST